MHSNNSHGLKPLNLRFHLHKHTPLGNKHSAMIGERKTFRECYSLDQVLKLGLQHDLPLVLVSLKVANQSSRIPAKSTADHCPEAKYQPEAIPLAKFFENQIETSNFSTKFADSSLPVGLL